MNVLIINLTRFGDLIQTQPVIAGFKSRGHRVGLVCLSNFASAAALLTGVDRVFAFPGAGLLAGLDQDWRLAVRDLDGFRQSVFEEFLPGETVNLTPSVSSRLLAYGLTPENGRTTGFTVDEFGFNADTSTWAAFLQLAGANRGASPFNVCDLFRRAAGLDREGNELVLAAPDEPALARAGELLSAQGGAQGFVALQLGASEERRRWPVDYFRETARRLYERDGLVPVLLGARGEAGLGERFAEGAPFPLVNCMGRTSLTELAGVLGRSRVLLTNDTGTMHLAAGLGVPLCAVFLATAQPWDTGPYRAGNICLEPDMDCHPCAFGAACPRDEGCRWAVTPEAMYACAKAVMDGADPKAVPGTRIWRTRTGADGFMELESLSGHDGSDRAVWIALQRAHFAAFLDGRTIAGPTGLGTRLGPDMRQELSKTLTSARDMLFLLSQQGALLRVNPRPQAKTKFLASWQRVQNILSSSNYLNILALLWMFESQRQGEDLASLLLVAERHLGLLTALLDELA
ncbi:ADP-heptose:LPS heptosyl transferase I [Pseudodesulfovibrio hydrargyri]|uniref:ADP-heptose:LPS heptosyl transferase I n=1 Tax=Pseudodesulfovibrio hydrargyri TaxID=2125990 RepID=A0A1J5MZA4_9BACT|nr:glycosyltransferase family 9 protein [Pseudodesulfovibrio hydrargyri]OIQ51861.1 ADP-heptose:LPS heptosyl transferase I [Pseudodesulfovibrio hydrargyri]